MNDTPAKLSPIAPLTEVLGDVAERFNTRGALGVVVVDAAPLDEIETHYGHDAHQGALAMLGDFVATACREIFEDGGEVLAAGEVGRSEIVLFLDRDPRDVDFFRDGLPAVALATEQRLARTGHRAVYPYLRVLPRLSIGYAYAMRNPLLGVMTELRRALEEARRDADLSGRLAARRSRRQLIDVIVSGQVYSVYEPIVDAKTLTVFGYEALARGPQGTPFATPLALFGLAEEEGLTFQLDCLCRRKAIEGAVDFPAGAKLFMNIRPSAIHEPSFQPDALKRTLGHCGLAPADVVFEISEQESIGNYEIFREARDAYGKLGFQFALDDTGAGYASLEAVLELGPEFIKIDRAFVHGIDEDPARQNMVRAFQAIAADTNARIIGEGLDTLEELQTLSEIGIPFGQGWLFGKPAPLRAERS